MQVDLQDLTPDEQDLCASIADGKQVSLSDKVRIDAQVLRHIVLGLPFKKDKGVFKALIRALRGSTDEIDRCSRTPVGISIEGGTIHGRLDIASAIGDGGGPICPLEFSKTTFENGPNGAGVGFSGANAHFSRLSFKNCAFADEDNDPDTKGEIRTICLSGAKLNAPLDMSGIHPKSAGGLLWVAAAGIRVKGGIDLSACRLRAPGPWRVPDTAARDALDLTLAEIAGDLHLLKSSRMTGRLKMRGARIHGDLWLNGANIRSRGAEESLFLQGTTIVGFLVMRRDSRASFRCDGNIDLTAVEVGRSLIFQRAEVGGGIKAPDLTIRDDFFLHASIRGKVDLEHMTIGGSLDLSHLRVRGLKTPFFPKDSKASLSLKDSNIGRELRLARIKADGGPPFRLDGTADLTGLSCDTLDDDIGRSWGRNAVIRMNHFTYRRAGWLSDRTGDSSRSRSKKPSYRIVSDWIRSRHADGRLPWRWFPRKLLSKDEDFWDPWQLRRNWIYQHYESEETRAASVNSFVSIARHKIREHEYRPQPFEQAIRVARAEGREDFAAHFDMHKQRLEWRFFNRGVRWPLGFVAIVLSSLWLCSHANSSWSLWLTLLALAATLGLMVSGSWIRDWICSPLVRFVQKTRHAWLLGAVVEIVLLALWLSHSGGTAWIFAFLAVSVGAIAYVILGTEAAIALSKGTGGRRAPPGKDAERVRAVSSKVLTWLIYWIPAILLFAWTDWHEKPFHYFVGFIIFGVVRLMAVVAHMIMRFGFGYLRRPIYAVTTLIVAFLVGWGGVAVANSRDMFVVAAEPTAGLAATVDPTNSTTAEPETRPLREGGGSPSDPANSANRPEEYLLMGSEAATRDRFVRDVPCFPEISEPLYALDVLIPIVDLGEEHRCEIRRFPVLGRDPVKPGGLKFGQLVASIPDLPFNDPRFWWWAKAVYAILGWFLVSLSILTFARVNKVHAEPPTEHR